MTEKKSIDETPPRTTDDESDVGDVESAGETTAAATGAAERGAIHHVERGSSNSLHQPVGADTMVRVADESD